MFLGFPNNIQTEVFVEFQVLAVYLIKVFNFLYCFRFVIKRSARQVEIDAQACFSCTFACFRILDLLGHYLLTKSRM